MSKSKFASLHSGLLARKGEAIPAATHPLAETNYNDSPPAARSPSRSETLERLIQIKARRDSETAPPLAPAVLPPPHRSTPPSLRRRSVKEALGIETPAEAAEIESEEKAEPSKETADCPTSCTAMAGEEADSEKDEGPTGPYKITLRMDKKQRQLLRLVAAVQNRSQQAILSSALNA